MISLPLSIALLLSLLTQVSPSDIDSAHAGYRCNRLHRYRMEVVLRDPLVLYLEEFITDEEADALIDYARPRAARSTVVGTETGVVSEVRTSYGTYLERGEHPVETCLRQRAASLAQTSASNVEPLQVVWYREGQHYEEHHDYFCMDEPGSALELERGGQREITIFGYLNSLADDEGGETYFPELNISVTPKRGDAMMWYNVGAGGENDPRTLHGGAPVKKGAEKWGTNIWIRLSEFA